MNLRKPVKFSDLPDPGPGLEWPSLGCMSDRSALIFECIVFGLFILFAALARF